MFQAGSGKNASVIASGNDPEESDLPDFPAPARIRFNLWSPNDRGWLSLLRAHWKGSAVRKTLLAESRRYCVCTGDRVRAVAPQQTDVLQSSGDHPARRATDREFKLKQGNSEAGSGEVVPGVRTRRVSSGAGQIHGPLGFSGTVIGTGFTGPCFLGGEGTAPGASACTSAGRSVESILAADLDNVLAKAVTAASKYARQHWPHPEQQCYSQELSLMCAEPQGALMRPVGPHLDTQESRVVIPSLLHFVWLGPSPLPSFFPRFKESWSYHNPCLTHALWTDEELDFLLAVLNDEILRRRQLGKDENGKAGNGQRHSLHPNPCNDGSVSEYVLERVIGSIRREGRLAAKSDMARLLLLWQYGGIYADVDVEAVKQLPACLFSDTSFFLGMQRRDAVELGNALLACEPRHRLSAFLLECLGVPYVTWGGDDVSREAVLINILESNGVCLSTGSTKKPTSLAESATEAASIIEETGRRTASVLSACIPPPITGPGFLTRAVMAWFQANGAVVSAATATAPRRTEICRPDRGSKQRGGVHCDYDRTEIIAARLSACGKRGGRLLGDQNLGDKGFEVISICPPVFFYPLPHHNRNDSAEDSTTQQQFLHSRYSFTLHHWKETWRAPKA
ncbi:glycosyltransferase family 32 protein [Cystoisospora suis]|uniref:Glycosyltransferase family 32 protein n=1 Tax=Cystoisospora suis TaxID=483139 RepID=A0A2C6KY51_9APIC|nr:glycosyltransferase family 32 protein [Cystoisospora suis]